MNLNNCCIINLTIQTINQAHAPVFSWWHANTCSVRSLSINFSMNWEQSSSCSSNFPRRTWLWTRRSRHQCHHHVRACHHPSMWPQLYHGSHTMCHMHSSICIRMMSCANMPEWFRSWEDAETLAILWTEIKCFFFICNMWVVIFFNDVAWMWTAKHSPCDIGGNYRCM
jgi:hypothetical protein